MWIDIPQPSGMMQRKLIWYMVYSITNDGKVMEPTPDKKLPYEKNLADKRRFIRLRA